MTWVAAAVAGSAVIGAYASNRAANTQANAANNATAMQERQWAETQAQQQPYRTSGYNALNFISGMMPGSQPTYDMEGNYAGQTQGSGYLLQAPETYNWMPEYQNFTNKSLNEYLAPGYDWRLKQGQGQVNAAANLGGGTMSGNTLKGLQDYTQNFASNEYGNALKQYMDQYALGLNSHIAQSNQSFNQQQTGQTNIYNRLASLAGLGQTSLGQTTNAGVVSSGQIGSNMVNAGSAQAAGQVGVANSITGGANTLAQLQMANNLTGGRLYGGGSTSLNSMNMPSSGGYSYVPSNSASLEGNAGTGIRFSPA